MTIPLLIFAHAATQPRRYHAGTVVAASGSAFVQEGGRKRRLQVGDPITLTGAGGFPVLETAPTGRLMVDLRGARLHLLEGTVLAVRQSDYRAAPVRRFTLRRGAVVADVSPAPRPGAVFEIQAGTVRTFAADTRYSLAVTAGSPGDDRVVVATGAGKVRVVQGDDRWLVREGEQLDAPPEAMAGQGALPDTMPQTQRAQDLLARSQQCLATVRRAAGFDAWLAGTEETRVLPLMESLSHLLHLPTYLDDRRRIVQALGAMQALCTLAQTTGGADDALPARVTPNSLEELGLTPPDRRRILDQFENRRLLHYRRLPRAGYEFTARAQDSAHHLIRGRNGVAHVVGNDDTD